MKNWFSSNVTGCWLPQEAKAMHPNSFSLSEGAKGGRRKGVGVREGRLDGKKRVLRGYGLGMIEGWRDGKKGELKGMG